MRKLMVAGAAFVAVLLLFAREAPAPTGEPGGDPLEGTHVELAMAGGPSGFFIEVSGLGSETEIVEKKKGGRKIPGRLKWHAITLKRGVTNDTSLSDWRRMVETGDVESARRNGTITLLSAEGKPVAQWSVAGAWPSGLSVSGALETLTLTPESLERTF